MTQQRRCFAKNLKNLNVERVTFENDPRKGRSHRERLQNVQLRSPFFIFRGRAAKIVTLISNDGVLTRYARVTANEDVESICIYLHGTIAGTQSHNVQTLIQNSITRTTKEFYKLVPEHRRASFVESTDC